MGKIDNKNTYISVSSTVVATATAASAIIRSVTFT